MRPPGALREQSERQTHERERETKRERRKRNAAKQPDSAAVASESETARIRTARLFCAVMRAAEPNTPGAQEFEKSAAAKRRALEILELQREEDEWCASTGCCLRAPVSQRSVQGGEPEGNGSVEQQDHHPEHAGADGRPLRRLAGVLALHLRAAEVPCDLLVRSD